VPAYWKAARIVHAAFFLLAAYGYVRFLIRTRFWLPRYVHVMAVIALVIGFGLLVIIPEDAPVNRGDWANLKRTLMVLLFPTLVYLAFVFYGGQHAAYEARRNRLAMRCPHCGAEGVLRGEPCGACGQIVG
jgi:hypothetical protein